jgi:hypothetical protein
MFLLVLLAVIFAVLWIIAKVDRGPSNDIRHRIDRELAAMETVERLFEARDRARQEMRRAVRQGSTSRDRTFRGQDR